MRWSLFVLPLLTACGSGATYSIGNTTFEAKDAVWVFGNEADNTPYTGAMGIFISDQDNLCDNLKSFAPDSFPDGGAILYFGVDARLAQVDEEIQTNKTYDGSVEPYIGAATSSFQSIKSNCSELTESATGRVRFTITSWDGVFGDTEGDFELVDFFIPADANTATMLSGQWSAKYCEGLRGPRFCSQP